MPYFVRSFRTLACWLAQRGRGHRAKQVIFLSALAMLAVGLVNVPPAPQLNAQQGSTCPIPSELETPDILSSTVSYFGSDSNYPPGDYQVQLVSGALSYNTAAGLQWYINYPPGSYGSTYGYVVTYNDGLASINAPGNSIQYNTDTDCQTANAGASVTFTHTGGRIGVYLNDSIYSDNGPGPNTGAPTFQLTIPSGPTLTAQFDSSEYYIAEDGGSATITVILSEAASQTVTVDYSTSDGTATAPTDYLPASGTLTFEPGATIASFPVIVNNAGFSQDLTVNLTLSNPTGGATLDDPSTAVLTIVPPDTSCSGP